jgi:hypothetical protein
MRFEVKGGGIAAILFAMTLLSGAVFVLGLLAGYDVGRQAQIDTAQLATSYPLQSPPAATPANQSAEPGNPAVQSASNSAPPATRKATPMTGASANTALDGGSKGPKRTPSQAGASPAPKRLVSASVPSAARSASSADSPGADQDASGAESENSDYANETSEASGSPNLQGGHRAVSRAAAGRHKPYNIEIQAAMDISGADKMMARLQRLGYTSHLVPTEIGGQRWYKVEVGPYATAEEASDAEAQLRQRYDTTYGGVARGNSAGQASTNDDSEE